jgi:hypothetical protein
MSRQINLSLAAAGDVAVLRNNGQREIKEILHSNQITPYKVRFTDSVEWLHHYYKCGDYSPCHSLHSPFDIIDVTRNGTSIFKD